MVVGLFDTGSGNAYVAEVVAVIPPDESDNPAVVVPPQDKELIPSYYRESPFSRAWLKMTSIRSLPDFFDKYSFSAAPKLPGYNPTLLRRLVGKKIVSAEELRSMDTTIWEVRPSQPNDADEEVLFSISAISSAVSTHLVDCQSDVVLHLTDLHYALGKSRDQHVWRIEGEQGQSPTLVNAIKTALNGRSVGLIIASGDFTFIGSDAEYKEAAAALSLLLGVLNLDADRLIIVPGNHDIQWATDQVYDHNSPVTEAPDVARKNYEDFYRRLMRHEPDKYLAMGRRFVLPSGVVLEVAALNSTSLIAGKQYLAGMGKIEEASFGEVINELRWNDRKSLAFRMLVIHHHLMLLENLEPANGYGSGFGIAVDAPRVQRMAAEAGVHLAIHGHKHRAFIARTSVFELPEKMVPNTHLGELSVVGGGSAGSKETTDHKNYFNLLEFSSDAVKVSIFQSQHKGLFGLMNRWAAGFTVTDGALLLQQWKKEP